MPSALEKLAGGATTATKAGGVSALERLAGGGVSEQDTQNKFQVQSQDDWQKEYGAIGGAKEKGYGVSTLTDPYSGKFELTYENPAIQSSQLLTERTAPSFDFTKPQKIDRSMLKNGRMPEEASQAIKAQFPADRAEELDHIIPLELGGSNDLTNLRLSGVDTSKENEITRNVLDGKISVLDAWKQIAEYKGIQLPEVPKAPRPEFDLFKPSTWLPSIAEGGKGWLYGVGKGIVEPLAHPIKSIEEAISPKGEIAQGIESQWKNLIDKSQEMHDVLNPTIRHPDPARDIAKTLGWLQSIASATLSPVTQTFELAGKIPGVNVVASALGVPFSAIQATAPPQKAVADKLVSWLPAPQESKNILSQALTDAATFGEQIFIGGAIYGKLQSLGEKAIGIAPEQAQAIADEAKTAPERPVLPPKQAVAGPEGEGGVKIPPSAETGLKTQIPKERQPLAEEGAPATKTLFASPTAPKVDFAMNRVLQEFDVAEAGTRFRIPAPTEAPGEAEYRGIPSTFPDWVSERLRSKALLDRVSEDIRTGKEPKPKTKEAELYDLAMQKAQEYRAKTMTPEIAFGEEPAIGTTLYGEAFPGAKYVANFVNRDILSRIKDKIPFIKKVGGEIKNAIIPDIQKERVRSLVRQSIAETTQLRDAAYRASENMINWWDKTPEDIQAKFLDLVEFGSIAPEDMEKISAGHGKFLSDVAKNIRERLDVVYEQEKSAGSLAKYVEDYLPHLFEKPDEARSYFEAQARKIGGSPYFEKPRVFDLIATAREMGYKLKTTNPERLALMRQFNSFQFQMEQNVLGKLAGDGLLKATEGSIPKDWKEVDNTVAKSFAKRESLGKGKLIAPEHAANLLNNWLSPSLWNKKGFAGAAFRDFMAVKNQVVAIKLGLSLFHGVMTTIGSMSNQLNVALFALADTKSIPRFIKELSRVPIEPIRAMGKGGSIIDAWFNGPKNEYEAETISLLKRGGYRPKMSSVYKIGMEGSISKAIGEFRNENPIGGTIRMIPEIAKAIQTPLMEWWVPRIKTDAVVNQIREFYETHKEALTEDEMNVRLGQIVDHADNLFGQMIYDNLFWPRWIRDLGISSSLSLGWNLGTIRDFGGALTVDTPRALFGGSEGRKLLSRERLLSAITYPIVVGTIGGLITYFSTGKKPDQLLDYFYPKDGTTNPDGSPGRIQIPAETKEYFALKGAVQKKGVIGGVAQYLWHKTNPTFATTLDLFTNKDFYGVDIRDENSLLVQQATDVAKYLATEGFGPISVAGVMKDYQTTGEFSVMPILGFTPAPKYITETPIQSKIFETYDKRLGGAAKSKEEAAKSQTKSKIRQLYLRGKINEANKLLEQAISEGTIKEKGAAQFIKSSDIPGDVRAFGALPATDQESLLAGMSLSELNRYAWGAKQEVRDKLYSLSDNARRFVGDYSKGIIKEPIWKQGKAQ